MLAHIGFRKAQFVSQNEGFPILVQSFGQGAIRRMQRHREKSKLHFYSLISFGFLQETEV